MIRIESNLSNLINQRRGFNKKIIKTVLELLSKEQKKHNKKEIIIRMDGTVSIVIAIHGTFFVNPEDILLKEIIDMIKSFQ